VVEEIIKGFFALWEEASKHPSFIPIIISFGIMLIFISVLRGISKLNKTIKLQFTQLELKSEESINNKIIYLKNDIDAIKEYHRRFEARHEVYQRLYDSVPVIDFWVKNFSEESNIVFNAIKTQLDYMKELFKKNYENGSHREKAENALNYAESAINEALDECNIQNKPRFSSVIITFVKFLYKSVTLLINSLSKLSGEEDKEIKKSLIKTHFSNLNKVVYYIKLKYPLLIELTEDELLSELEKGYNKDFGNYPSEKIVTDEEMNKIIMGL
jgi:hypothetical protein